MSLKNVEPINFQFQFINKEMVLHLFKITNASQKMFLCIILMLWGAFWIVFVHNIYHSLKRQADEHLFIAEY